MMNRRDLLKTVAGLSTFPLFPLSALAASNGGTLSRIAFGSCCHQDKPMPIWNTIAQFDPQLFISLGDNVYADTLENDFHLKYAKLAANPDYKKFAAKVPFVGTWDDHDLGGNDEGASYSLKKESKKAMLDFFREPKNSIRRKREGIYASYYYGKAPRRVQVIMLDLRWFRAAVQKDHNEVYIPNLDPKATLLGAEQWAWLERELRRPADLRLIGSSIQFVSEEHQWEKWGNFPLEKARMLALIDKLNLRNLVFLTGDMHYGELSQQFTSKGLPVLDVTSSGLNMGEEMVFVPNKNRMAFFQKDDNFGLITIDWKRREAHLQVRDVSISRLSHVFRF